MFKDKYTDHFILSEKKSFHIDSYVTQRNNNVCVCGSPGTGKTRSYLLPSLLNNSNQNYIVVDVKGDIIKNTAQLFVERGYKIQILNLKNPTESFTYNPFEFVNNELDICSIVEIIVDNKVNTTADPFWAKAEKLLLQALFLYLFYECCKSDHTISNVLKLLREAEIREDDEEFVSTLDIMFNEVKKKNTEHVAVKQYEAFKSAAGKTMKSIIISAYSNLFLFNLKTISTLTNTNQIDFHLFNKEKTILYVILDDTDSSLYPIANIFLTQAFQQLVRIADKNPNSRFDIPLHIFLDDFCSYKITDFDILIACLRSRNIGISILLQSDTQLISNYGESKARSIINCCDTYLYLGGNDISTIESISLRSGKKIKEIVNMPLNHLYIFRRGEVYYYGKVYDLNKAAYSDKAKANALFFNIKDYIEDNDFLEPCHTETDDEIQRNNNSIVSLISDAQYELMDQTQWFVLDENPQKNGVAFEDELLKVFKELGFDLKTTPITHDYGADLIGIKDDVKYCIQVKYRSKKHSTSFCGSGSHWGYRLL